MDFRYYFIFPNSIRYVLDGKTFFNLDHAVGYLMTECDFEEEMAFKFCKSLPMRHNGQTIK